MDNVFMKSKGWSKESKGEEELVSKQPKGKGWFKESKEKWWW